MGSRPYLKLVVAPAQRPWLVWVACPADGADCNQLDPWVLGSGSPPVGATSRAPSRVAFQHLPVVEPLAVVHKSRKSHQRGWGASGHQRGWEASGQMAMASRALERHGQSCRGDPALECPDNAPTVIAHLVVAVGPYLVGAVGTWLLVVAEPPREVVHCCRVALVDAVPPSGPSPEEVGHPYQDVAAAGPYQEVTYPNMAENSCLLEVRRWLAARWVATYPDTVVNSCLVDCWRAACDLPVGKHTIVDICRSLQVVLVPVAPPSARTVPPLLPSLPAHSPARLGRAASNVMSSTHEQNVGL